MQHGKDQGDQEIREELPKEWFQFAQEQTPEEQFFKCAVRQDDDQYYKPSR